MIRVTSSAGSPTALSTITMVTRPAWGTPAAPMLAAVAVMLEPRHNGRQGLDIHFSGLRYDTGSMAAVTVMVPFFTLRAHLLNNQFCRVCVCVCVCVCVWSAHPSNTHIHTHTYTHTHTHTHTHLYKCTPQNCRGLRGAGCHSRRRACGRSL
jgi:hypothetical protein